MGPWERYSPAEGLEIVFLSFDGMDWYKYREQVATKYLLMLDERSVVIKAESDDKAQLFPEGFYTLEVDTLPEDWEPNKYTYGEFGYAPYRPSKREILHKNDMTQSRLLDKATTRLMKLQGLILSEAASDEEKAEAESLKSYIKALKAVDLSNPVWPN